MSVRTVKTIEFYTELIAFLGAGGAKPPLTPTVATKIISSEKKLAPLDIVRSVPISHISVGVKMEVLADMYIDVLSRDKSAINDPAEVLRYLREIHRRLLPEFPICCVWIPDESKPELDEFCSIAAFYEIGRKGVYEDMQEHPRNYSRVRKAYGKVKIMWIVERLH